MLDELFLLSRREYQILTAFYGNVVGFDSEFVEALGFSLANSKAFHGDEDEAYKRK